MNWKTIRINKTKCQCGKGTIEQELKGDGFNNGRNTIIVVKALNNIE